MFGFFYLFSNQTHIFITEFRITTTTTTKLEKYLYSVISIIIGFVCG